jgi:hypothetical protein
MHSRTTREQHEAMGGQRAELAVRTRRRTQAEAVEVEHHTSRSQIASTSRTSPPPRCQRHDRTRQQKQRCGCSSARGPGRSRLRSGVKPDAQHKEEEPERQEDAQKGASKKDQSILKVTRHAVVRGEGANKVAGSAALEASELQTVAFDEFDWTASGAPASAADHPGRPASRTSHTPGSPGVLSTDASSFIIRIQNVHPFDHSGQKMRLPNPE